MTARYQKNRLPNGITAASIAMPGMESVSLGMWVKVGGRHETPHKAGISHFLEHLLFKGTEKRSCMDLKQAIEGIGGSFNAFTGEEFTCYFVKVLGRKLSVGFDILSDMILHASLKEEEVEKERMVILEEIKMEQDIPAHRVGEILNRLLWPSHPLGQELTGTPDTIRSLSRKDIVSYRDLYYHPRNLFIVACGAVDHGELLRQVRRHFASVPGKMPSRFVRVKPHPPRMATHFIFKKTAQSHLAIGLPALRRNHPGQPALSLLNVILGANMSSRLFQELRENRGLAYEIGSHLRRYQDAGVLVIGAGVDARKTEESLRVVLQELDNLKKERVAPEEFRRAREYYTGQLLFALEDTTDHMVWLGESLVSLDRVTRPDDLLNKISRVRAEDLKQMARRVFERRSLKLAVIGPHSKKDQRRLRG
ncbi:MAG: pitrilysin family protein, partial [Candidatus Omnitrophota bacterium]